MTGKTPDVSRPRTIVEMDPRRPRLEDGWTVRIPTDAPETAQRLDWVEKPGRRRTLDNWEAALINNIARAVGGLGNGDYDAALDHVIGVLERYNATLADQRHGQGGQRQPTLDQVAPGTLPPLARFKFIDSAGNMRGFSIMGKPGGYLRPVIDLFGPEPISGHVTADTPNKPAKSIIRMIGNIATQAAGLIW